MAYTDDEVLSLKDRVSQLEKEVALLKKILEPIMGIDDQKRIANLRKRFEATIKLNQFYPKE